MTQEEAKAPEPGKPMEQAVVFNSKSCWAVSDARPIFEELGVTISDEDIWTFLRAIAVSQNDNVEAWRNLPEIKAKQRRVIKP